MRVKLPRLTDRLHLGDGLEVSPVCLGQVMDPDVVSAAYEAGINFFFLTADMHWPRYEPLRKGLRALLKKKGVRDRLVVCATAYVTQPDFCEMPFEEALEALPELGRLDVLSMGGVYPTDFSGRLPVYRRHKETRFLGTAAIGASFHHRGTARLAMEHTLVDLAFIRFNASHPGAARDLFPFLPPKRTVRVYGFKSMDGYVDPQRLDALGLDPKSWRPRPVDHYRFALSQAGLDGVLVSFSHPKEVRALADALSEGPLDEASQAYLVTLKSADQGAAT
ncbi:MAG: hypothetical protein AMXMBFR34_20000 [Myxococcaceae bacterium]